MPVVGISTTGLRRRLGTEIESRVLADAVDQLGCDLEELAEVILYECPACSTTLDRLPREPAPKECDVCGHASAEPFKETGTDEMVRLDLLPARPDLFNATGLSRALKGYLGIRTGLPDYPMEAGAITVDVDPSVKDVRPFIACAQVDIPPLNREGLVVLFRLQEDLHWGVGRNRKKASIGIYDLEALTEEIRYTTMAPDFRFTPLGMPGRELTMAEILDEHPKGKSFKPLLETFDRYPVLIDSEGQVLSMPPIINSEETKIREGSTRLFVDVTGEDRRAVEDCLSLIVSDVCEMGGVVRTVEIRDGNEVEITPDLTPSRWRLSPERAAKLIGVPLTEAEVRDCLSRMRLGVEEEAEGGKLTVIVPRYRVDVKHEVDLIEDVAIANGYRDLPAVLVPTMTVGRELPSTTLARRARSALTGLGFTEVVTFVLSNREEQLTRMRLPEDLGQARIMNPISVNQEMVRVQLLSSLMGSFSLNRTREMPQPIFEVGDVVRMAGDRVEHRLKLAVGVMGPRADYATIRSAVDAVLHEMGSAAEAAPLGDHELGPVFLDGRAAAIRDGDHTIGVMGEVHPEVIEGWSLDHPVVAAEIDLPSLGGPVDR